jgi:ribonuclease VapC
VAEAREGDRGIRQCDSFLRSAGATVEPFTAEHALLARQGFSDYGKGRHKANLNFGDCFSYALAKATGEALLFKGDDFRKTDLQPALP